MLIQTLAERFCATPLPESVCADQVATMRGYPHRTGTTLLTVDEAKQVLTPVLAEALEQIAEAKRAERERIIGLLMNDDRFNLFLPGAGDLWPASADDLRKMFGE